MICHMGCVYLGHSVSQISRNELVESTSFYLDALGLSKIFKRIWNII